MTGSGLSAGDFAPRRKKRSFIGRLISWLPKLFFLFAVVAVSMSYRSDLKDLQPVSSMNADRIVVNLATEEHSVEYFAWVIDGYKLIVMINTDAKTGIPQQFDKLISLGSDAACSLLVSSGDAISSFTTELAQDYEQELPSSLQSILVDISNAWQQDMRVDLIEDEQVITVDKIAALVPQIEEAVIYSYDLSALWQGLFGEDENSKREAV